MYLTTKDNPYSYQFSFDDWYNWDVKRYNTLSRVSQLYCFYFPDFNNETDSFEDFQDNVMKIYTMIVESDPAYIIEEESGGNNE